jgi:hypothetical protein
MLNARHLCVGSLLLVPNASGRGLLSACYLAVDSAAAGVIPARAVVGWWTAVLASWRTMAGCWTAVTRERVRAGLRRRRTREAVATFRTDDVHPPGNRAV